METKSIIVCGGRDYQDQEVVNKTLDKIHAKYGIRKIITGGARGADQYAEIWAKQHNCELEVIYPDWETFGKAAGILRNKKMAERGADACVAFPGGKGTMDMIARSKAAKIPVWEPKC